jgi:TetR/AcrR family transcriptional regulator, regulator of cefoperazone and chloramphenicol sensitivity
LFHCSGGPNSAKQNRMENLNAATPNFGPDLAAITLEVEPATLTDDAKLRLLSAAESLFAERPIESVSLREIAIKAGNGNNNAVQYHFGGKDELVQAIFAWRVEQMEEPRRCLYAQARAGGRTQDLADLARILCLPLLDLVDDQGRHSYAAFMTQYVLRHRPLGLGHAADTVGTSTEVLRTLLKDVHDMCGLSQDGGGDYRIGIIHLMFANMLVLSDSERLQERDPLAFQARVDATLMMVESAFESVKSISANNNSCRAEKNAPSA